VNGVVDLLMDDTANTVSEWTEIIIIIIINLFGIKPNTNAKAM